ncbi:MAG: hypothetical protein AAGE96_20895 [Cyanobacteria bacterium P01_G01_bin.19]
MKRIIFPVMLILTACQISTVSPQKQTAELAASTQAKQEVVVNNLQKNTLISSKGIGEAKLGMTLEELRQVSSQDTDFEILPSFLEDIDAVAVSQKGIVQYYIIYDAESESESSSDIPLEKRTITTLITDNSRYQTKQGVKAGIPIKDAEDIYGNAVLAYNTQGQSGEYITFGDRSPENIKFRATYFKLISDGLGYSGIYPEYPGVSYTTDKYRNDAAIAAIEVSCDLDECGR